MTSIEQPLVSCIMPVRSQRAFVAQAIGHFLRQDMSAKELLIVDDGDEPLQDLAATDQVRYIHLAEPTPLGTKRNIACEASRGSLIAHWDHDDWQHPHRLRLQAQALLDSGRSLSGSSELLHYLPLAGAAWSFDARPHLAESTLLYRRECWLATPFDAADGGGAQRFLAGIPAERIHDCADARWTISVVHPGNAKHINPRDPRWQRRPLDDVAPALAQDWSFFAAIRAGTDELPATRPADLPEALTLSAHFMVADGYGSMAEYLALGLDRAGVALNPLPYQLVEAGLRPRLLELIRQARPHPAAPLLHFSTVDAGKHLFAQTRDCFIYTMWESDRLPTSWLAPLHQARAVLVPTRWCAGVFRGHGLAGPIEVVPLGVDPAIYAYQARPERPGLTTLMIGTNIDRKHVQQGIAAWKLAFADDAAARLLIKAHHQYRPCITDDPRIVFADVNEQSRGIAHWYRDADIFLALGNEGFGLPLVEAMACGLPAIALATEGQGDLCADAAGLVLPVPGVGWEPHVLAHYGRCGKRAIPSVEAIAAHLRWIATHRDEARQMGRAGSAWVLKHRNIWDCAPRVLAVVERWLAPPRRLRRVTSMEVAEEAAVVAV